MQIRSVTAAAAILTLAALPGLAQDAAPGEALPPGAEAPLPPGGMAPVDDIAPIADVAPDDGAPDAEAVEYACAFTMECVDDECAATDYSGRLTVISDGAGLAEAEWDDPSETVSMSAATDGGTVMASSSGTEPGKQRLLTLLGDGTARFTTHMTDPLLAITYSGLCEVAR